MSVRAPLFIALAVLFAGGAPTQPRSAPSATRTAEGDLLQNEALALQMRGPDRLGLMNKLTGKSCDIAAAPAATDRPVHE